MDNSVNYKIVSADLMDIIGYNDYLAFSSLFHFDVQGTKLFSYICRQIVTQHKKEKFKNTKYKPKISR